MNVYQKLQAARIKLQNTKLTKSGNNRFAGYQYFELGDFLPTIQAIFNEIGLCGAVSFTPELALLTVVNTEKPEETIVFSSPMAEAQLKGCHPIQNLGAVETYQRRYLWVTAMEIVEHDALDATTGKDEPSKGKGVIKATDGAWEALDEETQNYLTSIAMDVISLLAKGNDSDAYERIESEKLESDLKVGLWTRFDSKQRSALTKISNTRKAA